MIIGFTGTQHGMTTAQREAVTAILETWPRGWLSHGDCIGADADAHQIALAANWKVTLHPPDNAAKRAWCTGASIIMKPRPYLERNKNIVTKCQVMIAAPSGATERVRSGTWATIRYARRLERPICIVAPDGAYNTERWS